MKHRIIILLMMSISGYLMASPINERASNPAQSMGIKASAGIINQSADIVIQDGAYIVISGSGNYRSSGTGMVSGTGTLLLTGDFVNNNSSGEPVSVASNLVFAGSAIQSISGYPISFGNVLFGNAAGINIGSDTDISGTLTIDAAAGTINMTDYDFGVSGTVVGSPDIIVTGTGAVGETGSNATVTIESPQPTGLPSVMNKLVVNPGEGQNYSLPNSTSIAQLQFLSGALTFGGNRLLLRNHDLSIGGQSSLSDFSLSLEPNPATYNEDASINKIWNISGQSDGDLSFGLRWQNAENNGNDFSSGSAFLWRHNSASWILLGEYPILIEGEYNTITFSRSLGAKDNLNDFTITGGNQTLPVTLASFSATALGIGLIRLNWVSHSESNLVGYYVLRSDRLDIEHALIVSNLISASNSSSSQSYSYEDAELFDAGDYYYWLMVIEIDGALSYHGPVMVSLDSGTNPGIPVIPLKTELRDAYPNPFNPSTTIAYSIEEAGSVQIDIYNLVGQKVWTSRNEYHAPGIYRITWDGRNAGGSPVASGTYLYKMRCGEYQQTRKMILLK